MIAIVNISKTDSPTGIHQYEVRINRSVVATFDHKREDGLAVCLRKAAEAVEITRKAETLYNRMAEILKDNQF